GVTVVEVWCVDQEEDTKGEVVGYQRYLAAVGVQVEIHYAPDWSTYSKMLQQGKLLMFRLLWVADIPDPANVLSPLLHSTSPTNRTFYRNPAVDKLLEQAKKEKDR